MKKNNYLSNYRKPLAACNNNEDKADGYGNFEATEVTISAEANGKIEF
jgi:HlyD family secretion protein